MIHVSEVMSIQPRTVAPTDSLADVARVMKALDVGLVPVTTDRQLIGVVTDRDITVRGVAEGLSPEQCLVAQIMTAEVRWCYPETSIEEALALMGQCRIRRLAVVDRDHVLVGVVSMSDANRALRGAG